MDIELTNKTILWRMPISSLSFLRMRASHNGFSSVSCTGIYLSINWAECYLPGTFAIIHFRWQEAKLTVQMSTKNARRIGTLDYVVASWKSLEYWLSQFGYPVCTKAIDFYSEKAQIHSEILRFTKSYRDSKPLITNTFYFPKLPMFKSV